MYTKNGKYYIKRPEKLVRIEPSLDENGNVNLAPTREKISILNDGDLAGYSVVTIDDIKKTLTTTKKIDKPKVEEVDDTDKFAGLFGVKTVQKNKKTI